VEQDVVALRNMEVGDEAAPAAGELMEDVGPAAAGQGVAPAVAGDPVPPGAAHDEVVALAAAQGVAAGAAGEAVGAEVAVDDVVAVRGVGVDLVVSLAAEQPVADVRGADDGVLALVAVDPIEG